MNTNKFLIISNNQVQGLSDETVNNYSVVQNSSNELELTIGNTASLPVSWPSDDYLELHFESGNAGLFTTKGKMSVLQYETFLAKKNVYVNSLLRQGESGRYVLPYDIVYRSEGKACICTSHPVVQNKYLINTIGFILDTNERYSYSIRKNSSFSIPFNEKIELFLADNYSCLVLNSQEEFEEKVRLIQHSPRNKFQLMY